MNTSKIYNINNSIQFQDLFVKMFPELNPEKQKNEEEKIMSTKNITFVTNECCNLNCSYCYEKHKVNSYMSVETAKNAIDALFDKKKMNGYINDAHKCIIIEFIGGEPFMNMDVIEFVSEYLPYKAYIEGSPWYKYYMFSVTTNGTLWFDKRVQDWLHKYKNRISVSITIDGDKELHDSCRVFYDGTGSYDVVVRAVKDAIENYGMSGTKVTFAPENIDKINTAIPHLFSLGLKEIHANCVFEDVWKDEHAPLFFNELIKLADWMIDNKIYEEGYCSIFNSDIGSPLDPSNDSNW